MTAEKDAFTAVWTALLAESSIKCSITGEEHQSVVKPALIILSVRFCVYGKGSIY